VATAFRAAGVDGAALLRAADDAFLRDAVGLGRRLVRQLLLRRVARLRLAAALGRGAGGLADILPDTTWPPSCALEEQQPAGAAQDVEENISAGSNPNPPGMRSVLWALRDGRRVAVKLFLGGGAAARAFEYSRYAGLLARQGHGPRVRDGFDGAGPP
jgi:hypothetical protein